jgi:hypothetical protein
MNNSEIRNYSCFNTIRIEMTLFIIGIITNGICILIFSLIVKKTQLQSNMFKYLLIKSIIDFCICILQLMNSLNVCESFRTLLCFEMQIWIHRYLVLILLSLSIVFEIATAFDCYININKKFECCQTNLFFCLFSFCAVVVYFLVYLIVPMIYKLKKIILTNPLDNNTITYYFPELSSFGERLFKIGIDSLDSLLRDCLLFIILVVLNVLILISLIKATKRRRSLARNNNDNLMLSSYKAERKKMLMILTTGINYMIGHLPFFIVSFLYDYFRIYLNCSYIYINLLFYLSYVDGIIFYFLFNNIFRRILISPFIKRN